MPTGILPSDNLPIEVRRLGIFELDGIGPRIPGPYTYKIVMATGREYEVEYDLSRIETPPEPPDIPEAEIAERSKAWYDLQEYRLYHAALLHEKNRVVAYEEQLEAIKTHILTNCVDAKDQGRILTADDLRVVYNLALVPQLSTQDLVDVLTTNYQASFEGMSILDALNKIEGGHGMYNAIRVWENELMVALRMTEEEYAGIPIRERARKVVALKIGDWLSVLESDKRLEEIRAHR